MFIRYSNISLSVRLTIGLHARSSADTVSDHFGRIEPATRLTAGRYICWVAMLAFPNSGLFVSRVANNRWSLNLLSFILQRCRDRGHVYKRLHKKACEGDKSHARRGTGKIDSNVQRRRFEQGSAGLRWLSRTAGARRRPRSPIAGRPIRRVAAPDRYRGCSRKAGRCAIRAASPAHI